MKGTITYKGQPVNGALLKLYPTSGGDIYTAIPVGPDGAFSTADVPPGDYKIVVERRHGYERHAPPSAGHGPEDAGAI